MERPTFKPIGTPSLEFDTPSLVVDLDALEHNIASVHGAVAAAGGGIRPRLDAHLCPAIGHLQMSADATTGVAVSTLGQAEVFSQHGFGDILVTNLSVTRAKIARTVALARRIELTVVVDSERNIDDLSSAASDSGVSVGAAVAVRGGGPAVGVVPADAPALAGRISGASGGSGLRASWAWMDMSPRPRLPMDVGPRARGCQWSRRTVPSTTMSWRRRE